MKKGKDESKKLTSSIYELANYIYALSYFNQIKYLKKKKGEAKLSLYVSFTEKDLNLIVKLYKWNI